VLFELFLVQQVYAALELNGQPPGKQLQGDRLGKYCFQKQHVEELFELQYAHNYVVHNLTIHFCIYQV